MAVGEGIILNEQDLDVMRSHFRGKSHKFLKTPAIAFLEICDHCILEALFLGQA
ncbi:hypothetical protein NIES21_19670 [Anabaenopsis circularis NIES-21]|uniref:Uncharacterized protein n=1 Tax=Anabaenopsis circularis NIES-21 TaxID=1085406 RepID=A0A1Z4GF65_9CYAN|nr:hypothetical protein [Nostoc cycadae]BAY16144.1 hypothetical protein NIES21_19670 [Anabaenopsis circularis NIES-21]